MCNSAYYMYSNAPHAARRCGHWRLGIAVPFFIIAVVRLGKALAGRVQEATRSGSAARGRHTGHATPVMSSSG